MKHGVLEELRAENPVPEAPAPPPVERLLARLDEEPLSDRQKPPRPPSGRRRLLSFGPVLVSAAVVVAIAVAAFASLHSTRKAPRIGTGSAPPVRRITLHATETLKSADVTTGGAAGEGHFTISGAITDQGSVTDYRTVRHGTALVRRVAIGKKGTITFRITIQLGAAAPERWAITSGTGAYKGLHGKGLETVDNFAVIPATFVLKGTVF